LNHILEEIREGFKLSYISKLNITAITGSIILQFIKSMEILENKKFDIKVLVTHTFVIREVKDAFGKAIFGEGLKTLIIS